MSKRLISGTCVTKEDRLRKACEAMRKAGIEVEGPRYVSNYPMREYKKATWVVKLPGWYGECAFDASGNGDMSGDNESEYYDERPMGKNGQLIDKDASGKPYRVHPDVLAGKKRAGDDGTWGDIKHLRRLFSEYVAVGLVEEAARSGGQIAYKSINEATGEMELAIDLPEPM